MKLRSTLIFIIAIFIVTSLACSQAGEVLSPEEATRRAEPTPGPTPAPGEGCEGIEILPGDQATLVGTGFLVNLLDRPGGGIIGGQSRDSEVTITDCEEAEGEIWFRINADGSEGWVKQENIEASAQGPRVNDEVYLVGTAFLINILDAPNGNIVSADSRGEIAIITDFQDVDGVRWYLIDSRAGSGWVPEENISVEAP